VQAFQQRLGSGIWIFLQPQEDLGPYLLEGVWACSPGARLRSTFSMRRACFPLTPQLGQPCEELLDALPLRAATQLSRTQRRQGRLTVPHAVQQLQRVRPTLPRPYP